MTGLEDAWWQGYAAALRDFPHGTAGDDEVVSAMADIRARIDAGPLVPERRHLRLLRGGAA